MATLGGIRPGTAGGFSPSPRHPASKRRMDSVDESMLSQSTAGMSLGGSAKRFDHTLSPASAARLGALATGSIQSANSIAAATAAAASVLNPTPFPPALLTQHLTLDALQQGAFPFPAGNSTGINSMNGVSGGLAAAAMMPSAAQGGFAMPMDSIPVKEDPKTTEPLNLDSALEQMRQRASTGDFRTPASMRKPPVGGKWTKEEDDLLKKIVESQGAKNWKYIAELLGNTRTDVQCLHRWNKVLKPGLHKGPWTEEEDFIVTQMVTTHGVGNIKWSVIASKLPGRIGKQCRERWFNHLDPSIKKGDWTADEDKILFEAQRVFGNRWCEIAKLLPGRTENAVKNRWNSSARKRWFKENGIEEDPPKPKSGTSRGFLEVVDGSPLNDHPNTVTPPSTSHAASASSNAPLSFGAGMGGDAGASLKDLPSTFRPPSIAIAGGSGAGAADGAPAMTPNSGFLAHFERASQVDTGFTPRGWNRTGFSSTPVASVDVPVPKMDFSKPSPSAARSSGFFSEPTFAEPTFRHRKARAVQKAVREVRGALDATEGQQQSVPLEMVPYFRLLNDEGKKSIMKQLVHKHMGTAATPSAGTPLHAAAAKVEPVDVDGDRELDKLFEGDPLLSDKELSALWTLSPTGPSKASPYPSHKSPNKPKMRGSPPRASPPRFLAGGGNSEYEAAVAAAAAAMQTGSEASETRSQSMASFTSEDMQLAMDLGDGAASQLPENFNFTEEDMPWPAASPQAQNL